MALTCGFYNADNHDRRYDATDFSKLFDGIINDGVFMSVGKCFITTAVTGMKISVGSGRAWFDHTWTYLDTDMALYVDESSMALDRIDTVVLEVNAREDIRANTIKIIQGTPANDPQKPALTNNTLVHQHPLAYIRVKAETASISQADITSAVGTSECPFVTGILETVSVDHLFTQWQAQWEHWKNSLAAYLDPTDAVKIAADILDLQHRLDDKKLRFYTDENHILHVVCEYDDGT